MISALRPHIKLKEGKWCVYLIPYGETTVKDTKAKPVAVAYNRDNLYRMLQSEHGKSLTQ